MRVTRAGGGRHGRGRHGRHGGGGFTLLEILVALAVFGLLMVALTGGTQFGLRALAIQEGAATGRGDLQAADRALRQLLAVMVPGAEQEPPNIVGEAHRLAFTTLLPGEGGGREVNASLGVAGQGAGRRALVLRWTPQLHAVRLGPAPPPREVELLPGVEGIELGYWRADGAGGWLSGWEARDPPALVRLRIVFPDQVRHWPDIVVAPARQGAAP